MVLEQFIASFTIIFLIDMTLSKNLKKLKKNNNKNFLSIILVVLIFFSFLQEFNIFKNAYYLITKDYYSRATDAYKKTFFSGYCKGSSHGYLFYIKNKYSKKFKKNKIPKIINNFNKKKEYWIFLNINAKISNDQIIILNNKGNIDQKKYKIIDETENKCFFIEGRND
jgi:hypothetical protein